MKTIPDHPLTPEERELAQLIGRQGPHGEPPPALDARILAAAHAAVARQTAHKPKPRWPVAIGLAASVVFAIGIAWQLRPLQQTAVISETPVADSGAEPAPQAKSARNEEVAAEAVVAEVQDDAASAPNPGVPLTPAPASRPQPGPAGSGNRRRPPQEAVVTPAPRVAPYSARTAAAPPPPPAPAAPVPAEVHEAAPAFNPDPQADASARQQAAVQGAMRSSNAATARQAASTEEARATAARDRDGGVLERMESTGSRLNRTDLQVPVSQDAQLAVDEWLERVRTRYGLGDADAARQSLLLFVRDHPEEAIPDDLEPLLDE